MPGPPQEVSADEAPRPSHPLRQANQELYATNKKLANENASSEAKLQRTKAALSTLILRIETKLEMSHGGGDLMQRLSTAGTALLQHSAQDNSTPDDAIHPEAFMLTDHLKKLDRSKERLQDDLVELRKQLVAARQKKKVF